MIGGYRDEEAECETGDFVRRRNLDVPDVVDGLFSTDTGFFYSSMLRRRSAHCAQYGDVCRDRIVCAACRGSQVFDGDGCDLYYNKIV